MKYAMTLSHCTQTGKVYAANGVPFSRLLAELVRDGFSASGLTVQRCRRAYQKVRS